MSVNRIVGVLVAISCAGCGPGVGEPKEPAEVEWLLGTFSDAEVSEPVYALQVSRFTFSADNTARQESVTLDRVSDEIVRTWEARSETEVVILASEANPSTEQLVKPGQDCNTLEVMDVINDAAPSGPRLLHRGEVCTRQPDPSVPSHYEHYWCDEPPPPCEQG